MKKPLSPPDMAELFHEIAHDDPGRMLTVLTNGRPVDGKGRYLHWDQMRHRQPPDGLTLKEWWVGTATSRANGARELPFTGTDGNPFRFTNIDRIQEMVHRIDRQASGRVETDDIEAERVGERIRPIRARPWPERPVSAANKSGRRTAATRRPGAYPRTFIVANAGSSDQYLVSSLEEEAIASSLLEGAATTRPVAKELLRSGRKPRDTSEQMVLNNYHAMLIAEELATTEEPLEPDHVLELHRIVTDGTLDDPSEAGQLQEPGDERVAVVWDDGQILHSPPPAEELPARLERLCAFANGEVGEGFLHPVVRAVLLHFWLGHDHPFSDGNGRTARALFYWSMLRSGYWLAQYISISTILRKAPARYARSYLHTETDSNDVTYFVIHQLEVLERAIAALGEYLGRKVAEIAEVEQLLQGLPKLNHRQLAVVGKALRDPYARFTIAGQKRLHRVAYQSARTDMLGLEDLGVLRRVQSGKKFEFWPVDELSDRLTALAAGSHR